MEGLAKAGTWFKAAVVGIEVGLADPLPAPSYARGGATW